MTVRTFLNMKAVLSFFVANKLGLRRL